MRLHGLAHRIADLGNAFAILLVFQARQARQRTIGRIGRQGFGMRIVLQVFDDLPRAARPNTIRSSSELQPRRFAPCTDTQAHSPTA